MNATPTPRTHHAHDSDYRVHYTTRGDVLMARVSGEIDAQHIRIAYWRDIATEAIGRGLRKLLVTDRKKGIPATPAELMELAQLFREQAPSFDRVAVIEPTLEFVPLMEHAEIFGRAAGINVRIFGDPGVAERWVRYGTQDDEASTAGTTIRD